MSPPSTTPNGHGCGARRSGFVFQQFHLIPHLTALGNVETALLYRSIKASERRERAMDALSRVGLGGAPRPSTGADVGR